MSRRKNMGTAIPRLQQDYLNLNRDPVPYIRAEPLPDDMLEWHYVIKVGPESRRRQLFTWSIPASC